METLATYKERDRKKQPKRAGREKEKKQPSRSIRDIFQLH